MLTNAKADTFGDFTYSTDASSATITGYTGPGGDVVIPGTILNKPVFAIGTNAFKGCVSLTNVTLPSQVRRIQDSAFAGCTGLTSITIPNAVSQIEVAAFSSCSNLTSVYFDGNATTLLFSITPFANSDLVTVYYYARTTGWKTTFGGRPTATRIDPNASDYQIMPVASFKASITSYTGSNSVVTIPNTINGMTVIGIGDEVFHMRALLKSVIIPAGVTTIGVRAFAGCSGLTNLSIPNSVARIGNEAFSGCQGLKEITIPSSLASIPELAFENCRGLGSIVIPNGVTNIANWAFINCRGITNATIPDSVIDIAGAAFENCSSLTSITIPSNVTSIRNSTFYQCIGLTDVIIPNSVTNIQTYAFYGCRNLTSLTIPNSVTSIGNTAFYGCSSLTSLVIPDGVANIENYAFSGCSGITNVTIPNSVTNIGIEALKQTLKLTHIVIPSNVVAIGAGAFSGCASLTSITLTGNIAEIGAGAFEDCSSLVTIAVDANNAKFSSLGGALFNKNQTILIRGPGGSTGTYAIPGNVTNIAASAFSGCTGLTNITIPTDVTTIGNYAFKGCTGLGSIQIPSSVTAIGFRAFAGCIGLTNEVIPDSVTSIGTYAFEGSTNLTSITVGALNTNYASIDGVVFSKDLKTLIQYPPGRIGSYSVPGSVTNIPSAAFGFCGGLTSVTIPESVIKLGSFSGCTGLTAINVDSTNPIYASMNGVVFDKTLTTLIQYPPGRIGDYTVPAGVPNIGNGAFNGCINLTSSVVPESVVGMGYYAFSGCVGLTNITLPNTITNIGDFAFTQCKALTGVTIPESVTKIGFSAFSDCTALASVFIEGNAPTSDPPLLFDNALNVTVYYRAGTTGWRASYGDRPTALWIEQAPASDFTYGITNSAVTITGYTGPGGHVIIPDVIEGKSVTGIGTFAFGNLTSLTGISIPNSVSTIGDQAFFSCTALTDIMIPNSVTYIGWYAFDTCTGLTKINIGTGLTSLGVSPFHRCNNLQNFTVDVLNPAFCSVDGVLFDKNQTLLIKCPARKSGAYEIPGGVTKTSDWAFLNCINLTRITVPKSFTTFGISTFLGCSSLMKVYFEGNAPGGSYYSQFDQTGQAMIYYRAGATGWSNTYAGQPTSLWNPQALTSDAAFGVQTNQYGFNISGAAGITVVVEACTNLANPTWLQVATNTFTSASSYFSDPQWTNYPNRFYRFSMP